MDRIKKAKKILITGASGFLGGHLMQQAAQDFQTLGVYWHHAPEGKSNNWIKTDVTDYFSVFELVLDFHPDVIIHAAANSRLDDCEEHPEKAKKQNIDATSHLSNMAAKVGARFIFISTDMVFDGKGSLYSEQDRANPISVYGKTKLEAEAIVQTKQNHVIVRSALIYGRPQYGGSSFFMWMENLLQEQQSVPLYTDQFRSPILVDNLAEILLELCLSEFTGLLHLGGANRIDRHSFGRQMCDIFGYDSSLLEPTSMSEHHPSAPRPRDVSLNIEKAMRILKTPILSTEQGLLRMKNKSQDFSFES